jgi:hypothetical protein
LAVVVAVLIMALQEQGLMVVLVVVLDIYTQEQLNKVDLVPLDKAQMAEIQMEELPPEQALVAVELERLKWMSN